MKKLHLIALACIGVAVTIFLTAADDLSSYATFAEAAAAGTTVRVAGELSKDRDVTYDPEENPNYFSFFVRDSEGKESEVVLLAAKPQDFEMSEQIVVTGEMQGGVFLASDMLMKCPSKYKDEEIYIKGNSSAASL